ncbi:hypothetical protein ABZ917_17130 [Nonomuraea wenchangensis]
MTRFQCPHCEAFHRTEDIPKCRTHGLGYGRNCSKCRHVATQIPCAQQGT